jgi:hypothetical protein
MMDIVAVGGDVAVYGAALSLVAMGLWLVWGGRVIDEEDGHAAPRTGQGASSMGVVARANAWRRATSHPTRMTLGLSALFLGYHVASWWSPAHWMPLRVEPGLWWVLVGGIAVACVSSIAMDRRLDARADGGVEGRVDRPAD